jgi:hypothetical protein
VSLVSRHANFTFVAGAALVTTSITFALAAPGASAAGGGSARSR